MNRHPAFRQRITTVLYFILWTGVSGALTTAMSVALPQIPVGQWILFGAVFGYLFGIDTLLIWNATQFGNYASRQLFPRWAAYTALGTTVLLTWLLAGYSILYIFLSNQTVALFFCCVPFLLVAGILLYIVVVQWYNAVIRNDKQQEEADIPASIIDEIKAVQEDTRREMLDKIVVKAGQKIEMIPLSSILYLQAEGDYVLIFTVTGHHIKEQTMKYFEEHLPENQFVRVHRSFIVNIEAISKIELYEKQNQLITLKNGKCIKASITGYKLLKYRLQL